MVEADPRDPQGRRHVMGPGFGIRYDGIGSEILHDRADQVKGWPMAEKVEDGREIMPQGPPVGPASLAVPGAVGEAEGGPAPTLKELRDDYLASLCPTSALPWEDQRQCWP